MLGEIDIKILYHEFLVNKYKIKYRHKGIIWLLGHLFEFIEKYKVKNEKQTSNSHA